VINHTLSKKNSLIIFFLIVFINIGFSNEVSIKFKINNEIVTNVDIEKEYKYLMALNNSLQSINKNEVLEIAKTSIIKEIIKKIELIKYFDLDQNPEYMEEIIKDFYTGLDINSESEFEQYLNKFGLKLDDVKKKLEIEAIWNEYIYKKFKDQVVIDEDKLKRTLKKKIMNNNIEKNYLLAEILFNEKNTSELKDKYDLIKQNILEIGFENTANKYSQSDSARNGGNIGWIKESQLSDLIKEKLVNLKIGEFTNMINLPGGVLIIKIKDIKEEKINLNFEDQLKKFILYEKNRQLNQFSIIHFNRIKQNVNYSEK